MRNTYMIVGPSIFGPVLTMPPPFPACLVGSPAVIRSRIMGDGTAVENWAGLHYLISRAFPGMLRRCCQPVTHTVLASLSQSHDAAVPMLGHVVTGGLHRSSRRSSTVQNGKARHVGAIFNRVCLFYSLCLSLFAPSPDERECLKKPAPSR